MAGKITTNSVQLGDSTTASQNFVLQTNLDGTAKLSRGNLGVTTQDVLNVNAAGVVTLLAPPTVPAQSMVRLNTANGYGSANTRIPRFTTAVTTQGTDITYADSSTLGASFTINTKGVYAIAYCASFTVATNSGVSLNSTQLTTSISAIILADRLGEFVHGGANFVGSSVSTLYLNSGDIVRPHTDGATLSTTTNMFTITRVA